MERSCWFPGKGHMSHSCGPAPPSSDTIFGRRAGMGDGSHKGNSDTMILCTWLVLAAGWGILSLQGMLIRGFVCEREIEVKPPITTVNNGIMRVIITHA